MNSFNKLLFVFIAATAVTVSAQSIVSTLSQYQKTFQTELSGISVSSISGVTFHPASKTLYVVDDEAAAVYEITTEGNLLRTITLSGFDDTEGIAFQSDNYFFVVEERVANLVRVLLPQTGSGTVYWDSCTVLSLGEDWGNSGLEDVAYCATAGVVYAIKEFLPPRLYKITLNTEGDLVSFTPNDPFSIENNSGDAAGIFALADSTILLLSQDDNKLMGYSGAGSMLSELPLGMTKPEGVSVDLSDSTIYVVGEPRELFVFKKPNSEIQIPDNSSFPIDFSCKLRTGNNKTIDLQYSIPSSMLIRLEIITVQGRRIATLVNETKTAGKYQFSLDKSNCPAGACLFVFKAGPFYAVRKNVVY